MAAQFMIKTNGVETGPFSAKQLKALSDSGKLAPGACFCLEQMHRWWIPTDLKWIPVVLVLRRPRLRDIKIPRSTAIVWACIAAFFLVLVIIRNFG